MQKIKHFMWLVARLFILGPFAIVAVLGQYSEEVFEYLDPLLGGEDD